MTGVPGRVVKGRVRFGWKKISGNRVGRFGEKHKWMEHVTYSNALYENDIVQIETSLFNRKSSFGSRNWTNFFLKSHNFSRGTIWNHMIGTILAPRGPIQKKCDLAHFPHRWIGTERRRNDDPSVPLDSYHRGVWKAKFLLRRFQGQPVDPEKLPKITKL